tara:strand:- start:44661 stop:45050 length:390 start_codon:yes stop_codon:yes gene_type:complete
VILVDTSVWIDWLRQGQRPKTKILDSLIDEEETLLAPVVLQELLQGARGAAELAELRACFEGIHMLLPSAGTYADAGSLYARCRWAEITPRSPHDCLIAQLAVEHGVPLLQDERDFTLLAQMEPKLVLM